MTERKIALSIEEAADYTGIGRNTLRKLVEWKKLPVTSVPGVRLPATARPISPQQKPLIASCICYNDLNPAIPRQIPD